jgi:hypothetical protein
VAAVTVPAGTTRLVDARFTAESLCAGISTAWCVVRIVVINSADIVAYLEHRYPVPAVWPEDPALRIRARAWERRADTELDAILHDMSYGGIGSRGATAGLLDAGAGT